MRVRTKNSSYAGRVPAVLGRLGGGGPGRAGTGTARTAHCSDWPGRAGAPTTNRKSLRKIAELSDLVDKIEHSAPTFESVVRVTAMNLRLKEILCYCHKTLINSCNASGSVYSDTRIICADGSISYSKFLLSFVDPVLVNILQEKNEEDDYQKIVLCPDFQRKEFIESWHAILFTSDIECAQDSYLATSKVIDTKRSVESEVSFQFQLALSKEESSDYFDDHDPLIRRTSTELESKSNEVLCNFCARSFPNQEKLKKHFYNVHHASKNKFECFDCKKLFSSQTFLLKHKSSDHKEVKKCAICLKLFKTIAEYKLHIKRHEEIQCELCGKTSSNKFNYERHLLLHDQTDQTKKFNCELCQKRFSLKHQLDRHKLIHAIKINQLVFCPNCNRSFKRNDNMKRHLAKCI